MQCNTSCQSSRMWLKLTLIVTLLGTVYCQCDDDWSEYEGSCYRVNAATTPDPDLNWHAARDACYADAGDLVSIQSDEERDFVLALSGAAGNAGNLWIGLNQLQDRDGAYEWSDGSSKDYTSFAPDEPVRDGNNQCIYSSGSTTPVCFERSKGINTVDGLYDRPNDYNDPPDAHYFGYRTGPDDIDWCENECAQEKNCNSYTFISNSHPDYVWQGECMGVSTMHDISVSDQYANSGMREICGEIIGDWKSDNCGITMGYVCKKSPGSGPATPGPTETVPGYCPEGWLGLGNKCYKMVGMSQEFEGLNWEEARDACRAEDAYLPDLASFHSKEDSAIIVTQIQEYNSGFWIGYSRKEEYDDWTWSDNSRPDDWTYWAVGEPTWGEHCTEVLVSRSPTGMWNNYPCQYLRGYICQSYKDSSNPINTPPVTTPHNCAAGYTPYWYGCYKYVATPTSWVGGEQACAIEGGHLSSVHAEAENAALLLMSGGSNSWLGFRQGGDDIYHWTDGWPSRYERWAPGEPDNSGDGCVLMNTQGSWNDSSCSDLHPYFCKQTDVPRPTTPDIGDGACPSTDWKIFGSNCYYFGTSNSDPDYEQTTWDGALEACVVKGAGHSRPTSLASVHSWLENEFIYSTLNEIRGGDSWYLPSAWIGLSKKELGAPFVWTDGTPYDFQAWGPGEPNDEDGSENCVEMYVEPMPGLWNDHLCSSSRAFVCKTELGEAPTTPTLPPDGPGDCPATGDWERYGTHCYLFMPDEYETWDFAHGECKRFGGSIANLASIHAGAENFWVQNQLVAKSNMPVRRGAWIGLKKTSAGDPWSWIEPDQEVTYTNWAVGSGDPGSSDNCVEMYSENGFWNDESCSQLRGYVCRAIKTSVLRAMKEAEEQHEEHHGIDFIPRQFQNLDIQNINVNVPDEDDRSNTASIALSAVGGVLAVTGIIAAVVLVKRTPKKKTKREQTAESIVESTTEC